MDRTEVIQLLKEYVTLERSIAARISEDGVPTELCRLCNTPDDKRFIDELNHHQLEIARRVVAFAIRYKVVSISKEVESSEIWIKTAEEAPVLTRVLSLSGTRRVRVGASPWLHVYPVPFADAPRILQNLRIRGLLDEFDGGASFCSHLSFATPQRELLQSAMKFTKHVRRYRPVEALHDLYGVYGQGEITHLYFCCGRCCADIQENACRFGPEVRSRYCQWRLALLMKLLQDAGMSYSLGEWYRKDVFLNKARVLISVETPYGSQQRTDSKVVEYLKRGVDLIVIDEGRIVEFRHDREIVSDLNAVVGRIVTSLQTYERMEQGSDHERYVKALARIGSDCGFVPVTERRVKGSIVDCVWLDAEGDVFAAIEVETSGSFKKDIVSTWETGPELAVICIARKTDSPIHALAGYELLKVIPHTLLVVNTATENAYLFDKQEVVGQYQLG